MGTSSPSPVSERVSDAERDRTVNALRDRSAEGYLSPDTFVRRLERAFQAQRRSELTELVSDLPPNRPIVRHVMGAVSALSTFTMRLEGAWKGPRLPRLTLPDSLGVPLAIGRSLSSDLVLGDPTVSRRHAEVCREQGGWRLLDLGSTNGTRVNGRSCTVRTSIRPGDRVSFGHVEFLCTA